MDICAVLTMDLCVKLNVSVELDLAGFFQTTHWPTSQSVIRMSEAKV